MIPTNPMSADEPKDEQKSSDHDELVTKIVEKLKDASDDDLKKVAEALNMDENDSDEPAEADIPKVIKPAAPVVDTSLLTGSRSGLKDFLMKKSMDNSSDI